MLFIEPQAPIATVVYPCTLKDVHSASCIDNIIVSKLIPTIHSGIIIEDVSDHFPVFYCFSEQTQKHTKAKPNSSPPSSSCPSFTNFSKENVDKLKNKLNEHDWEDFLLIPNPSDAAASLNNFRSN